MLHFESKGKLHVICDSSGLSLSFESPIALRSTPVANLLFCGQILSTTDDFNIASREHQAYTSVVHVGAMHYDP